MRCERCNNREATFFYSSNINGEKSERHLCAQCAREEGFGGALDYNSRPLGMFGGMFDDMFSDFFSDNNGLLSSFGSFGMPMRSIMAPSVAMPRVNIVVGEPERAQVLEDSETKIPVDAGEDIKSRREMSALKLQLDDAIKAEDFEKAAQLRDQIRRLES